MRASNLTKGSTPPEGPIVLICPSCGENIPEESVWIFDGKIYCREACARKGAACQ